MAGLSVLERLAAGRLRATLYSPYFTSALLNLVPVAREGYGTLGVTARGVMIYDPNVVTKWSPEELATVLVHEVGHVLRIHHVRSAAMVADPKLWNLAADAEINDDFEAGGPWKFPTSPVLPSSFGCENGDTAEAYYNVLRSMPCAQCGQPMGQHGQGQGQGDAAGGQGDGQEGQDGAQQKGGKGKGKGKSGAQGQGQGQGQGSGQGQPGQGQGGGGGGAQQKGGKGKGGGLTCPSCRGEGEVTAGRCGGAAGNPTPEEAELDGQHGRSETEMAATRRTVAEAIREAAQRGQGNVPGGWARWAELELKPPKIKWQDQLKRIVRNTLAYRAGSTFGTYNRPNRRQAAIGYGPGKAVLSARIDPTPEVLFVVDTSGSMGTEELSEALTEARGVLLALRSAITFMTCDAEVHGANKVSDWQKLASLLKGGGGTDFRPVFEAAVRMNPRPDLIIFFTDGQGPAPAEPPPGIETIWLLGGPYATSPCQWGKQIKIEADGAKVVEAA